MQVDPGAAAQPVAQFANVLLQVVLLDRSHLRYTCFITRRRMMLIIPWRDTQRLFEKNPWPPEKHMNVIEAIVDIMGLEAISRARLILIFNPEENAFVIIKQKATVLSDWTPYPSDQILDLITKTAALDN
jgi:hypothetical protein